VSVLLMPDAEFFHIGSNNGSQKLRTSSDKNNILRCSLKAISTYTSRF